VASIFPRPQPTDYFLWGYLMRIYQDNPDTLERLKQNSRIEIRRIPRDMLERVVKMLMLRWQP